MQINIRPPEHMDRMVTQPITPPRRRTPTPIRMPSMKIVPHAPQQPNKELPKCLSNRNLHEQASKPFANLNNVNHQDMSHMWDNNRKGKPMISPIRNEGSSVSGNNGRKTRDRSAGGRGSSIVVESRFQENISGVVCANHPQKIAEFMIYIETEVMEYCERCAAQLASQGFAVHKLEDQSTVKKQSPYLIPELPFYPQYQNNPMYNKILDFLKELNTIEGQHFSNMKKFDQTDQHYERQFHITENFYDQVLKTIQVMKEDHLADLTEQSKKHSQIADIEKDYLRENVDEMEYIRKDIEDNLQTIMEKVEEDELDVNLNEYKQKIYIFKNKTEQQEEIFNQIINYTQEELSRKHILIQDYLLDIWLEKQPKNNHHRQQSKENINNNNRKPQNENPKIKNIMQMKPPNPQQGKQIQMQPKQPSNPAFRKLFDDEGENQPIHHETSPQFKNI